MDLGLQGRIALVTGGDSGIGWSTARELLDEGATVALTDYKADELEKAAEKLDADPGRLLTFVADLTKPDDIRQLRDDVAEQVGAIDILVHCAGDTGATGKFHEIDDEGWVDTLDIDLLAPVRLTRAFLDDLRASEQGRLVFVSSENAVQPYDDELPYDTAKAGMLAFAKGLSRTYALEGLRVNTVSPAFIHTPMTDKMMDARADELGVSRDEAIESFLEKERPFLELKRRGEPEEVAAVIAFLCSSRTTFVNGANYRVDGGSVGAI